MQKRSMNNFVVDKNERFPKFRPKQVNNHVVRLKAIKKFYRYSRQFLTGSDAWKWPCDLFRLLQQAFLAEPASM